MKKLPRGLENTNSALEQIKSKKYSEKYVGEEKVLP
jgi:hypothetical protein